MSDQEAIRQKLNDAIRASNEDYTSLSRMLGRNPAYIQQFIKRGVPRKLDEDDRRKLAEQLGIPEADLGARSHGGTRPVIAGAARSAADYILIPYFDAIGASAGPGALTEAEEAAESALAFQMRWVKSISGSDPELLSVIKVQGDSMLPTLGDGDPILVDRGDDATRLRDGIYVMRTDDALLVKRITRNPAARTIRVSSDNSLYPDVGDCDPAQVDIIGRVIWVGRQLR